ncbi:hypothetical protein [Serratia ureilytica]|uniref:hypothetical protein n=1 Tax=Serratia ureilytica TaxID=300181 RepID=UPI003F803C64
MDKPCNPLTGLASKGKKSMFNNWIEIQVQKVTYRLLPTKKTVRFRPSTGMS